MNTSTLVSSAEEEQQLPSADRGETMARQIVNNVLKTLIKITMHVCVIKYSCKRFHQAGTKLCTCTIVCRFLSWWESVSSCDDTTYILAGNKNLPLH